MIRTIKTDITCNKETYDRLFECNRESARLYNDIIDMSITYDLETNGNWIGLSELQKETKRKYKLHSKNITAIVRKFLFARDAARKARKKGYNNKNPYKKKSNMNTIWIGNSFKVLDTNSIRLSLGVDSDTRKRYDYMHLKTSKDIPDNIKTVELIYDGRLMLCISYDDNIQIQENTGTNMVGVDLGEIHSMACVCNNGNSLIISGRKMRSTHRFRNKKLGELQRKMSKCKKDSRNYKKYEKAKKYILNKSENQINDSLHKTSRAFVNWCNDNDVSKVIVGDMEGVQRNTRNKINKHTSQKLSNWSFGKLLTMIQYKQEQYSTELVMQEESYTTQQCPCCGTRKKTSTRNYVCACGYSEHRDIHSAVNIMSKYLYGDIRQLDFDIETRTYLRII